MWKKLIITSSLIISFVLHYLFFNCLYWKREENSFKKNDAIRVTKLFEVEKPEKEITLPKQDKGKETKVKKEMGTTKERNIAQESNSKETSKSENRKEQPKESELISLGKKVLSSTDKGSFPPLSLDYDNPREFLKGIYEMGGKTYLYDNLMEKLVGEADILNASIKNNENFPRQFSPFKRVIEDDWIERKIVNLYSGYKDDYQILLLIPEELEAKWIGHQLNLFHNHQLTREEVAKVIANFENRKMTVKQIILKNGVEIKVADKGV